MRPFIKQVFKILAILLILMYGLDMLFTFAYYHPKYPRNKASWIKKMAQTPKTYDYALFGSSRCIFNINPQQIEKETGFTGINLGYSGSNLLDVKITLRQFLKEQHAKTIFIQVDDQFNKRYSDPTAIMNWLPFIREPDVYKDLKQDYQKEPLGLFRCIPFYRFLYYDGHLGIRNVVLSYVKPNNFEAQDGFSKYPNEVMKALRPKVYQLQNKPNPHVADILALCKASGCQVWFFTAPYYEVELNTDVLEQQLENYVDFSNVLSDYSYFGDQTHLNSKGAKAFTTLFSNYFFGETF